MKKSMKLLSSFLSIGIIAAVLLTSCNKDTDPVDKDFFIGQYEGHITYTNVEPDNQENVDITNGNVKVVKVGSSYNFIFSDGIPDIGNVKFKDNGKNSVISIGSSSSHYIKIDEDVLKILFNEGDETWTANCNRK